MDSQLQQLVGRQERPAYVRFERVAVEDPVASRANGRYMAKDVDFVLITPTYTKDVFKQKVSQWLIDMDRQVQGNRIPPQWAEQYRKAYEAWLKGQELPLYGTPIRGWPLISPAQQEMLVKINVLTVEDLDRMTEEGMRAIGLGAVELKQKAHDWLEQAADKGPLVTRMAELANENEILKKNLAGMSETIAHMQAELAKLSQQAPIVPKADINVEELFEEDQPKPTRTRK